MQLERSASGSAMRRRLLRASLAFVVTVLAPACGGDGPTGPGETPPPGPAEATAPVASSATLAPMQEIELSGLPAGRTDLQADVTAAGAGSAAVPGTYQLPLFPTASGRYRLVIPLHPVTGVGGGAVDVRVRGGGDFVTAPLRLSLAPLPPAPGAFAASLDSLQLLVDLSLESEGLTRADVLAANARDVLPKRLLPLAIVQTLLDDPSHGRDLRDLLNGSSAFTPLIGTSQFDRDLVDRLVAAAGMPSLWNAMLDTARASRPAPAGAVGAAPLASATSGPAGQASAQAMVGITNAYDLHTAMRRAAEAKRAIDPNSPTTRVRGDVSLALGAAGLFAGPAAGAVIAGISVSQYLVNTALEAIAKTLPSEFVENSMTFAVDIERFLEDEQGPGSYSDIRVSAKSEGMVLDKAILNAVLQVVGASRAAGSLYQAPKDSKSITDWITDVGSFITETLAGKVPDADGMLRIDPETWTDIPLVSEMWTSARVAGPAIALGDFPTYLPVETGQSVLTLETRLSLFGDAAPAFARRTIEVAELRIEAAASRSTVAPGDVVTIEVRVLDALDPGVKWELSAGSWASGPIYLGDNHWRRQLQTPSAAAEFPVRATFTSTATGGARSTPGAPVRSTSLQIFTGMIIVEPYTAALLPGESKTFTATVLGLENKEVTWSAIGPDGAPVPISATGQFTAPTQVGEYLVIATSVQDPEVRGVANVTVGGSCSWSLTINGGYGGTWSGVLAGHFYPDEPSGGGNFTMTFERDATSDYPIGTVWAAGPGSGAATGSWPANFSFSPANENSMWVAVTGGHTETEATLNVSANNGTTVVGGVTGTAMLALGEGKVELASFTFAFRSVRGFDCGSD